MSVLFTDDWLPAALALLVLAARFAWVAVKGDEAAQSMELRRAWVKRILAAPGAEILAIQTLRNSMMAATLMATTATLALIGLLSIGHGQMSAPVAAQGWPHGWLLGGAGVKLLLPLAALAAAIVLFSKAVRLYHRCGYSLGMPHGSSDAAELAESAAMFELTRAATLYRSGWRAFYIAIATGAWLSSGVIMLVTTAVIVVIDIAAKIE